jgi:hypothetical protein
MKALNHKLFNRKFSFGMRLASIAEGRKFIETLLLKSIYRSDSANIVFLFSGKFTSEKLI